MKKFVLGVVVGLAIALPVGAHADIVSMIGKVVDGAFPVKVNGKTVDQQAIVIEGTSYLPVRAMGNALNMDVGFDADMGITLTSKKVAPAMSTTTQSSTTTSAVSGQNPDELRPDYDSISTTDKIQWLKDQIDMVKNDSWLITTSLEAPNSSLKDDVKKSLQDKLTFNQKRLDFLSGLLSQLQAQ